jgi:hypothetical protein
LCITCISCLVSQARLEALKQEQPGGQKSDTAAQLQARLEATAQNIRAAENELQAGSNQAEEETGINTASSATTTTSTTASDSAVGKPFQGQEHYIEL